MKEILLDSLLDSLIVLAVLLLFYFILSFFEGKLTNKLSKKNKLSPLIGSVSGIIPQCGVSVIASDLYVKKHITMGTLVAVFIATSDEAIPIMLSTPSKIKMLLPFILIKVLLGFIIGFSIDLIMDRKVKEVKEHLDTCEKEQELIEGCCHHIINDDTEDNWIHSHLIHPLIHALKIFAYVLIVNLVFGLLVYWIGEENIATFFENSIYLTPLFAVILGLIPNCVSSVILTQLYISNTITFGAAMAGLIVNAGLGLFTLYRLNKDKKNNLIITSILVLTGLVVGYILILFK